MSDINSPLRALVAHGGVAPVLYTDEINGQQVMRDDVWLCTTAAMKKAAPQAAPRALSDDEIRAAIEFSVHKLEGARVWDGMGWHYNPLAPFLYRPALDRLRALLAAAGAPATVQPLYTEAQMLARVAAERERCAMVCEGLPLRGSDYDAATMDCAAAIRAA